MITLARIGRIIWIIQIIKSAMNMTSDMAYTELFRLCGVRIIISRYFYSIWNFDTFEAKLGNNKQNLPQNSSPDWMKSVEGYVLGGYECASCDIVASS